AKLEADLGVVVRIEAARKEDSGPHGDIRLHRLFFRGEVRGKQAPLARYDRLHRVLSVPLPSHTVGGRHLCNTIEGARSKPAPVVELARSSSRLRPSGELLQIVERQLLRLS